jgi:hypothetical protein
MRVLAPPFFVTLSETAMPEYHFDFNEAVVPIALKLAKLVVQLDAKNHEVARQAILRALKENRCSLPDLAGIVERAALLASVKPGGLTQQDGEQIYQHAYARGRQDAQGEQASKPPTWRDMIEVCWNNINHLDDKDRGFIGSIRQRVLFDEDASSEKQQKWIRDCYRKVQMNGFQHV